ncbi:hypothetical protein [Streptomyces luteocolor]|uniref:hypothetical protein n=1 Tax=Streptomyces luteocolor TaxID=285500 RepID=UPI0008531D2F|nr:hypothetical protein [Streptomyces luteocolor]
MYKRLPMLTVCFALAAFGASACGPSKDGGASVSATPATQSASANPSESPSAPPAEARGLKGLSARLYLRTIREHYPDLDDISDEELVAHGDALCAARGQALVDQAKKTKKELGLTGKQASQILGTAHGSCGRNTLG